MPDIPAQCTKCGYRWQPDRGGLYVEGPSNVTISNVATTCPECGGRARFLDGTFDVVDSAIVLKSGPEWSWDLVAELRLGLKQIIDEKPADPVAALAGTNPEVADAVRRSTRGWSAERILALLGTLYAVLGTDYSKVSGNVSVVVALIETVLQHAANAPR